MAYTVNRKIKRVYAPGSFSKNKVNPWQTLSLTKKHKKLFSIGKRKFSIELRQSFKPKSLLAGSFKNTYYNNVAKNIKSSDIPVLDVKHKYVPDFVKDESTYVNKDYIGVICYYNFAQSVGYFLAKKSQIRPFLASSFWGFHHPIAVVGAVKMRRAKNLFHMGLKAVHNLNLWFGGIGSSNLASLYKNLAYNHMCYNNYSFGTKFDSYVPNFLVKIGGAKNPLIAQKIYIHKKVSVSPYYNNTVWQTVYPSSIIMLEKIVWAKNLSSLYKGCSKKV